MSALYLRATPSQSRILRAVEGAIRNAQHAHEDLKISPRHRRGIAKRAAGTLTAQWPDVLAAKRVRLPSDSDVEGILSPQRRRASEDTRALGRDAGDLAPRVPLGLLIRSIACQIRPLRVAGKNERAEALVEVLKLIHTLRGSAPRR